MKDGLYQVPRSRGGGKVLVVDGKPIYAPPLPIRSRDVVMACDELPVWARDEQPAPESEFTADDEALAKHIGAAVSDAIRSFRRKGRDEVLNREDERLAERSADRAGNMTSQNDRGRDALPDPNDHRRDFRSGDSVSRDELDAALKAALAPRPRGLATDSRSGMRNVDRRELLGLT